MRSLGSVMCGQVEVFRREGKKKGEERSQGRLK
jgi:hypothetical protein